MSYEHNPDTPPMTGRKPRRRKSPTQRTLEWLRRRGYMCAVVERRVSFDKPYDGDTGQRTETTVDLFGFIDVIAVKPGTVGALGIQTTTWPHFTERLRKVKQEARAGAWLAAVNAIKVFGWRKEGRKWEPVIEDVTAIDVAPDIRMRRQR